MELSSDLSEFVRLMNERGVDYLLVGGWAVGYHSVPRFTADIDFFIRASRKNAQTILKVLKEFGFSSLAIKVLDLIKPHCVIQLGRAPNRIDLLTSIDGVSFEDAWRERVNGEIGGVPVSLISVKRLMENKKTAGRPKDLMDLHSLQKVLKHSDTALKQKEPRRLKRKMKL